MYTYNNLINEICEDLDLYVEDFHETMEVYEMAGELAETMLLWDEDSAKILSILINSGDINLNEFYYTESKCIKDELQFCLSAIIEKEINKIML